MLNSATESPIDGPSYAREFTLEEAKAATWFLNAMLDNCPTKEPKESTEDWVERILTDPSGELGKAGRNLKNHPGAARKLLRFLSKTAEEKALQSRGESQAVSHG